MSRPVILLAALMALAAAPARAGSDDAARVPLLLTADELVYDENRDTVTARGGVEVSQGDRVLLADRLTYDRRGDTVSASGNISLLEPTGEVVFAQSLQLSGDLREGVIEEIRILLQDNARIAARGGRRSAGNFTEMANAIYSPCKVCEEDGAHPPLWAVKARRVLHDQQAQSIEYKDATLEFFGVPVAYTPYLSQPDPTVNRRTGFLAPRFSGSSKLGSAIQTPYYWVIDDSKDATVTPLLSSKELPVLIGEYRQRFDTGEISLGGSLTYRRDTDRIAGHVDSAGRFDIDDTWRWGFDLERASDDDYLEFYNFSRPSTLTTNVFEEGFRGRSYARIDGYLFQGLEATDDPGQTPRVLPYARLERITEPGRFGTFNRLSASLLSITRDEGVDSQRLSLGSDWVWPYDGPLGDRTTLTASLRGDAYYVRDRALAEGGEASGPTGRLQPQLAADWRFPLIREDGIVDQIFEPLVTAVWSPNGGNPEDIPNEDSLGFEFDAGNLFSHNRYDGIDRVEGGARVSYGFRWGVYSLGAGYSEVLFGQSYRLRDDDTFAVGSGLEDNFSDYVGRISIRPSARLNLVYRFRLDKDNMSPRRNEIELAGIAGPVQYGIDYLRINEGAGGGEFPKREEITASFGAQLSEFWRGRVELRRDLTDDGGMLHYAAGLAYEDECFIFDLGYRREFDDDTGSEDVLTFRLVFKTLGEVQSPLNII